MPSFGSVGPTTLCQPVMSDALHFGPIDWQGFVTRSANPKGLTGPYWLCWYELPTCLNQSTLGCCKATQSQSHAFDLSARKCYLYYLTNPTDKITQPLRKVPKTQRRHTRTHTSSVGEERDRGGEREGEREPLLRSFVRSSCFFQPRERK